MKDRVNAETVTVSDAIRKLLTSDHQAALEYLKESFVTDAMLALFHARRDARLTQAQVAERLSTKQSSIGRLERDLTGSVTLRRYVEVALACGVMPLDLSLVPVEQLIQYAADDPEAPKTQVAFSAWTTPSALPLQTKPLSEASTITSPMNASIPSIWHKVIESHPWPIPGVGTVQVRTQWYSNGEQTNIVGTGGQAA